MTQPRRRMKASLTDQVVNGVDKLLQTITLPAVLSQDTEIRAALKYLSTTVDLWRKPENVLRRREIADNKEAWKQRQKEVT